MSDEIDYGKDTAAAIFTHLFMCRIPNLQSMSVDYIKHMGMPTTGDPKIDAELANQLITTYLPISKMVEYFKDNVPVYITKKEDVKLMYRYISNHLTAWKQYLNVGLNLGNAPIDDLILLDQFANTVYDEAKYEFTRETANSLLLQHMTNTVRVNRTNFFKSSPQSPSMGADGVTTINADEDVYPKRESLSELFKDRRVGRKVWN